MVLISGQSAAEIADSVRGLVRRGDLTAGSALPPIRALAADLAVNRNTVASAYALLATAGVVDSRRRAGTIVLGIPQTGGEGASGGTAVNLASGNPDPALLPDWSGAFNGYAPVLYGADPMDERLRDWALRTMPEGPSAGAVSVAGGAVDAVERLLAVHLIRGDAVAVEDPGFFLSVGTLRVGGYRTTGMTVDAEGVTPGALRAALASGVRAVIITSRAQNPTGASVTDSRAVRLRAELAAYPDVLVIEDDHFSALAESPYQQVIAPETTRWAIVRSVSKFLGPDLRLAVLRTDTDTAARLAARLGRPSWVSHLLQHVAAELLTTPATENDLHQAATVYTERRRQLTEALATHRIPVFPATDGLNIWIPVPHNPDQIVKDLATSGWAIRSGSAFGTNSPAAVRVTISTLTPTQATDFATTLSTVLS
ncbi:aminotransferase class I/II-fold pyridoxal phosphate-dependent enzyme [Actinoplanes couchii]|uniref:Transcriptional regulator PtsJ n=1 Tax=Actinoplanes couchii TaxID=403638 RepID=A0ABQ3XK23_9ACTN|nr:aminotransferase class I/II-fold pyridoxal phosphate-dependent enzyme [Actinoplanes couchii]MDR6320443.1 DNA-binding transcriptional MocR family regulator [Actinoplanes couchii]GID58846.1 transcriptional regulator PtsJ [Actinoplanes couchii]